MADRSITVLGGGIVGLCSAYFLAASGWSVTLLDTEFDADSASVGNAGSISPGAVLPVAYKGMLRDVPKMAFDPRGPLRLTPAGMVRHAGWLSSFVAHGSERRIRASSQAILPLVSSSLENHAALLARIGGADLLGRTGQLHLYPDRKWMRKDSFGWALRREHGVLTEELDRDGILALEPSIGINYQCGVFLPEQGMIRDLRAYRARLHATLREMGVCLVVDRIRKLATGPSGGFVLEGARGNHDCDRLVVSAGAWSADLLKGLGYRLPLINQRGFHVQLAHQGPELRRIVVLADRKIFVTPMRCGLRAAGTVEITPLQRPFDMRRAEALVAHLRRAWPDLNVSGRATWGGDRPCFPDSLPVIGPAGLHQNLWFNFGHGHLGLTLGPSAAQALTEAIETGRTPTSIGSLGAGRFAS